MCDGTMPVVSGICLSQPPEGKPTVSHPVTFFASQEVGMGEDALPFHLPFWPFPQEPGLVPVREPNQHQPNPRPPLKQPTQPRLPPASPPVPSGE